MANGARADQLMLWARWACIPISTAGAYFAYRWSQEMYGPGAGLLTLILWTFEPNLLAHAELVTPDCAAWSFGLIAGYAFWRWLVRPTPSTMVLAGLALGLAQLTKLSWLLLYPLFPGIWGFCRAASVMAGDRDQGQHSVRWIRAEFPQLAGILGLSVLITNCGYGFQGTGAPLGSYEFVSRRLAGPVEASGHGNRFRQSWLSACPVPFPMQYVLGIDTQQRDFESFANASYLRGEWKHGGWWYYYLYGLLVKVPVGIFGLAVLSMILRRASGRGPRVCADAVVVFPALLLVGIASIPTAFADHVRYVFPALALALVFVGQVGAWQFVHRHPAVRLAIVVCLVDVVVATAAVYPGQLAHFNWLAGGSTQGWRCLLGSSFDWGQDLKHVAACIQEDESLPATIPVVAFQHFPVDPGRPRFRFMTFPEATAELIDQPPDGRLVLVSIDAALHQYATLEAMVAGLNCAGPMGRFGRPVVRQCGTFLVVRFVTEDQ